jgi:hypothetical protein
MAVSKQVKLRRLCGATLDFERLSVFGEDGARSESADFAGMTFAEAVLVSYGFQVG